MRFYILRIIGKEVESAILDPFFYFLDCFMIVFIAAQIKSRACVVSLSDMYAHRVAGQHLCHEFFFSFIKIQRKIKNFLEFLFVPVEILKILPVSTQVPISFGVQVENFRIENINLVAVDHVRSIA